jgi:hypothetical protein
MAKGGHRWGAGRPGWHVKVEHCLSLDVRDLARRKMLGVGIWSWRWWDKHSGETMGTIDIVGRPGALALNYTASGTPISEHVTITQTACTLGGSRPWFACPRCGRQAAKLYLRQSRFACRQCHRLVYASQSEDGMDRAWRKQQKLESKLGEGWERPKGMHHKTRDAILAKVWACEEVREDALAAYCERVGFKF